MTKKQRKRQLSYPVEAWWFISNHPKFRLRMRSRYNENTPTPNKVIVDGTFHYTESVHMHHHAISNNLGIYYTRVNNKGSIDKDNRKNINPEVWLEWGPIQYRSDYNKEFNKDSDWQIQTTEADYFEIVTSHDGKLDCGATTFDQALCKLARKVLKEYGDYKDDRDELKTCGGKETCPDCKYISEMPMMKSLHSTDQYKYICNNCGKKLLNKADKWAHRNKHMNHRVSKIEDIEARKAEHDKRIDELVEIHTQWAGEKIEEITSQPGHDDDTFFSAVNEAIADEMYAALLESTV